MKAGRSGPPRRYWAASGLVVGLLASVLAWGWFAGRKLEFRVTLIGCGVFHSDGLCELAESRTLRLFLDKENWQGGADGVASIWQGPWSLRASDTKVDQGRLLELSVPEARGSLRLVMRQGLRWQLRRLPVRGSTAPDWLRSAKKDWAEYRSGPAQAALEEKLQQPLEPEVRAIALGLLARIAREQDRVDEAHELFTQALVADRKAGLISNELDDVMSLARLLNRRYHQIAQAEALWQQREPLLVQMPEVLPWRALHLSIYRQRVGDLRAALRFVEEGKVFARRYGEFAALAELSSQQAMLLNQMGRIKESEINIEELLAADQDPCRQAELLADQGWLRILQRMALRPLGNSDAQENVRRPLELALHLTQKDGGCDQPNLKAKLFTYLGHLSLLEQDAIKAIEHVGRARQALRSRDPAIPHPAPELEMEWLDIEGRSALAQGQLAEAQKSYESMMERSLRADDYEASWRARIGRAQALEDSDRTAALALYGEAESYLDERSLNIPLSAGRGTFLGRFEWGTRLHIDLLERSDRKAEAMRVARHARARGLWALSLTGRIARMEKATRERWESAFAKYLEARRQLDVALIQSHGTSVAGRHEAEEQEKRLSLLLSRSVEGALEVLGERPEKPVFQEPEPGEVLLTCHPVKQGWMCFAASSERVESVRIDQLDPAALGSTLSEQILRPFESLLKPARRVRIIAYGEMRQIDFHRLLLGSTRLGEGREVVYSLDAPWFRRRGEPTGGLDQTGPGLAVLLFDPDDTLPASRGSAGPISELLRRAGWRLRAQIGGEASSQPDAPLTRRDELLRQLSLAQLFHYAGHADFVREGTWQHSLRISDQGGLLVGDLLLLEQAPPAVSLFACNSGLSSEEIGGQEGLGLAQTFLLRGSRWVVGTVRDVDDKLAAEVATAFFSRMASQKGPQAVYRALYEAVRHAETRLGSGQARELKPENDLGAFRLYVR